MQDVKLTNSERELLQEIAGHDELRSSDHAAKILEVANG